MYSLWLDAPAAEAEQMTRKFRLDPLKDPDAHWDDDPPTLTELADFEQSWALPARGAHLTKAEHQLAAVGLEISARAWRKAPRADQQRIVNALKVRLWIASAITESLSSKDVHLRRRSRRYLDAVIALTRRNDRSLAGPGRRIRSRMLVGEAAAIAHLVEPILTEARRASQAARPHELERIRQMAALTVNQITSRFPNVRRKITDDDLRRVARASPRTLSVSVASAVVGVREPLVRDQLGEDQARAKPERRSPRVR
jgi:hypothetical protein